MLPADTRPRMENDHRLAHLLSQRVQATGRYNLQINVEKSGWAFGFHSERRKLTNGRLVTRTAAAEPQASTTVGAGDFAGLVMSETPLDASQYMQRACLKPAQLIHKTQYPNSQVTPCARLSENYT